MRGFVGTTYKKQYMKEPASEFNSILRSIKTNGQKLIEITSKVLDIVENTSIKEGILNLSILHIVVWLNL